MKKIYAFVLASIILIANAVMALEIHVTMDGDDSNAGTKGEPVRTIGKAKEMVRQEVADGAKEVNVLIGNGIWYLEDGVVFNQDDGGTDECRVTYKTMDEDDPAILMGGIKLQGWEKSGEDIWEAKIPEGKKATQIFENGKRVQLARYPDEGYLEIEGAVEDANQSSFYYKEGDLSPEKWDMSEARVFIWQGMWWSSHWFSQDKGVKSFNPAENIIEMDSEGGYPMNPGNEYYVYNVPEFISRDGEGVLLQKRGQVILRPSSEPIEEQDIFVTTARNLIRVQGSKYEHVKNLHFENLDIIGSSEHTIVFENAEDCSVKFSKITGAKMSGLQAANACERITVYGNEISDHGYAGVELVGGSIVHPPVYSNHHHRVENNHIHHCGRLVGHGCGVYVFQSGDNKISHNYIHHMPRYGTAMNGTRYQVLKKQIKEMTWENHYDYLHTRRNEFSYNRIHHVNLKTQDTGAMESWGPGRDNVYNNNLIYKVGNMEHHLQSGIYADDATDHLTVTNNIIYDVIGPSGVQPMLIKGIHNKIHNNIMIVGKNNCSAIRSIEMGGEPVNNHVYTNNIIYYKDRDNGRLDDYPREFEWKIDCKSDGKHYLWVRYASGLYGSGRQEGNLNEICSLSVDNGDPMRLSGFKMSSDWSDHKWGMVLEFDMTEGEHLLRFYNELGSGIKISRFVVADNEKWEPENVADNTHTYTVKADMKDQAWRSIYEFNNWSEDRVAKADNNLFWKHGGRLLVQMEPNEVDYYDWVKKGYDANSVIADPMFYDIENKDFRLKPESPAFDLGFKQIETENIGLKNDYPERLSRK